MTWSRNRLDLGPHACHRFVRWTRLAVTPAELRRHHHPVVKPQKVESVRSVTNVHNPTLVRVHLEMKGLGCPLEPCVGLPRVGLGPTQDHQIIRVANDLAEVACFLRPESIEGMAIDVAQERQYRSALGYSGHAGDGHPVLQHTNLQPHPYQPQHPAITHPPGY